MGILSLVFIPFEEVWNAFRWWYGAGARWIGLLFLHEVRMIEERDHLLTWARNLFTPMYGDSSIQGRLISIGMRVVVLGYKLLWAIVWLGLHGVLLVSFLLLPFIAVLMLVTRFSLV